MHSRPSAEVFLERELATPSNKKRAFDSQGFPTPFLEHLVSKALLLSFAWELVMVIVPDPEESVSTNDLIDEVETRLRKEDDLVSIANRSKPKKKERPASPAAIKKLKAFHEGPEYSGAEIKALFREPGSAQAQKQLTAARAKHLIASLTGECDQGALDELRAQIYSGEYPPEVGMEWLEKHGHDEIEAPMQMSLRQQLMDLYATGEIGRYEQDGVR